MADTCEWNPEADREAHEGEHQVEAVWSVGRSPSFHLCASCIDLPGFKRFRRRKWIGPLPRQSAVLIDPDDATIWQVMGIASDRVALIGARPGLRYEPPWELYGWIKVESEARS